MAVRFQAQLGNETALLDAVGALVVTRTSWLHEGSRGARLYEGEAQPGQLLLLSDWESREAADAHVAEGAPEHDRTAALCARPPQRSFLTCRARREWACEPVGAAACTCFYAPPRMAAPLDVLLTLWRNAPQDAPGLVGRRVYRDEDVAGRFVIVSAWRSVAAREASNTWRREAFLQHARELGFSVERFVGNSRAERDRISVRLGPSPRGELV